MYFRLLVMNSSGVCVCVCVLLFSILPIVKCLLQWLLDGFNKQAASLHRASSDKPLWVCVAWVLMEGTGAFGEGTPILPDGYCAYPTKHLHGLLALSEMPLPDQFLLVL